MSVLVEGHLFQKVCDIKPVRDESGKVIEDRPHPRYRNIRRLRLHRYGGGPFCSFRIPSGYSCKSGVYLLRLNGDYVYAGKAEDLGVRFNQGYGSISPRNCFEGGRQTNCRVNRLILGESEKGSRIELFFHETDALDSVEREIIDKLRPPWNKAGGDNRPSGHTKHLGKYTKIGTYLSEQAGNEVTLSYSEIEGILDFKLPSSAYKHRPWWSNGSNTQCRAWIGVGWRVDGASLGNWVRFRKESDGYV
jgi:hypothetical protein